MNETSKQIAVLSEQEQKRYRYELSKLSEEEKSQFEALVVRMVRSGAKKPLDWAWSEFTEGIPQWARFIIINGMYQSVHDVEGNVNSGCDFHPNTAEVYKQIIGAVGEEKTQEFLKAYGKGMLHNMLSIFDDGNFDHESNDSWILVEYDRESDKIGKPISGLHEDFLEFGNEIE